MADEKSKNLTGADGPDTGPAQPEAGGGSPAPKQESKTPEVAAPEKTGKEPGQTAPAQGEKGPEIPKEQKGPSPPLSGHGRTAAMRLFPATAARRPASLPDLRICPVSSAT